MKRYEVYVRSGDNDVKVYESDMECECRVLVDGVEVYKLTAAPTFLEPPKEGFASVLTGGSATATYPDAKGKPVKILDKKWGTV